MSDCPWTTPGAVVKTFLAGLPLAWALAALLAGCFRFRDEEAAAFSSGLAENDEVPGMEESPSLSLSLSLSLADAVDWDAFPFVVAGFFRVDDFSESFLWLEPLVRSLEAAVY